MDQKETPTQIFLVIIGKFTMTPNLKNISKRLHWKVFCKNIFQIRTQQKELLLKKIFTCSVKGCSNQSRLNKSISYHKVLAEERKDLILIKDGKRFMQNQIKNRKHFSIHQYQNFKNFNIKHLQWSKADLPKGKKRF